MKKLICLKCKHMMLVQIGDNKASLKVECNNPEFEANPRHVYPETLLVNGKCKFFCRRNGWLGKLHDWIDEKLNVH